MPVVNLSLIARQLLANAEAQLDYRWPYPINAAALVQDGVCIAIKAGLNQVQLEDWVNSYTAFKKIDLVLSLQPLDCTTLQFSLTEDLSEVAQTPHDHLLLRSAVQSLLYFEVLAKLRGKPWIGQLLCPTEAVAVFEKDEAALWLLGQLLEEFGSVLSPPKNQLPTDLIVKLPTKISLLTNPEDWLTLDHRCKLLALGSVEKLPIAMDEQLVLHLQHPQFDVEPFGPLWLERKLLSDKPKPAFVHLAAENLVR